MRDFEELDFCPTRLGDLSLRRRRILSLGGREVFEVKLAESFLMSSLFHDVEVALADFALNELRGQNWDVVVGGLGLGYTARAALRNPKVRSVLVVEALEPVLRWHRDGLVPLGKELLADERCQFVHGDFFALAGSREGFDPGERARKFHAVLLDIDHSPVHLLDPAHAGFYRPGGLRALGAHLTADGVFAQWSDDPPDAEFLGALRSVFGTARAEVVRFDNPLLERESASTVYVARQSLPFCGIETSINA